MNLDAAECSRRRCSDNGRCEEIGGETTCACSPGYRGDSCQEHVLKTMQGPIVYGAAGLCVCVAIIVTAVVIKRRKSASTRFLFHQLLSYHSHLVDPIIEYANILSHWLVISLYPSWDVCWFCTWMFPSNRTSSAAAVKETSMTDLETTVEGSGAQPSPAEADKPEVNPQIYCLALF